MRDSATLFAFLFVQCHLFSPEVHYRNIFTIIDSFRTPSTDKDRLSRTIDQFQLYMVANAYPKIAARILNGGNTWETHPIETLATYDLSQIHIPPDKTLLVKRREIFNWLTMDRGITAEHPTFESGGTAFRITRHNIRPWVDALTETYIGLKNALIENGVCKEKLGGDEIITATMMLTQFHGLLETGLVEFLLEDKPLFKAMGKKKTNANHRKCPSFFFGFKTLFLTSIGNPKTHRHAQGVKIGPRTPP